LGTLRVRRPQAWLCQASAKFSALNFAGALFQRTRAAHIRAHVPERLGTLARPVPRLRTARETLGTTT